MMRARPSLALLPLLLPLLLTDAYIPLSHPLRSSRSSSGNRLWLPTTAASSSMTALKMSTPDTLEVEEALALEVRVLMMMTMMDDDDDDDDDDDGGSRGGGDDDNENLGTGSL